MPDKNNSVNDGSDWFNRQFGLGKSLVTSNPIVTNPTTSFSSYVTPAVTAAGSFSGYNGVSDLMPDASKSITDLEKDASSAESPLNKEGSWMENAGGLASLLSAGTQLLALPAQLKAYKQNLKESEFNLASAQSDKAAQDTMRANLSSHRMGQPTQSFT